MATKKHRNAGRCSARSRQEGNAAHAAAEPMAVGDAVPRGGSGDPHSVQAQIPMRESFGAHSGGRKAVERLQVAMSAMPQIELPTQHYFSGDVYGRSVSQPAGVLVVGKVHRKEHFYIVCCGTVRITQGDGPAHEVTGPAVLVSKPGTKRAIFAVTDVTYMTVHRTEKTDLDEIEAELVEPDGLSLFDARNKLKALP